MKTKTIKRKDLPKEYQKVVRLLDKTAGLIGKKLIEIGSFEGQLILYFEDGKKKELVFSFSFPSEFYLREWNKE